MRGDVHVQFGGECLETYYSDIARRWVLTLLDFRFKENGKTYNYPTIIFYQMGYSLFTIWQASRRHYRLNQTEECRTYYMAYEGTVQQAVIGLVAEKMSATSAIQGKFSAEGISAMAQGVDVKVRLAQALSQNDTTTGSGLQEMFDVLNADNASDEYPDYVPMKLLAELVGEDAVVEKTVEEMMDARTAFDLFSFITGDSSSAFTTSTEDCLSVVRVTSSFFTTEAEEQAEEKQECSAPAKKKKMLTGQMSLF